MHLAQASEPSGGEAPPAALPTCSLRGPDAPADVVFPCGHAFCDAALAPYGDGECVL